MGFLVRSRWKASGALSSFADRMLWSAIASRSRRIITLISLPLMLQAPASALLFVTHEMNMQQRRSEMSDKSSENSEMHSVEFVSDVLRDHVAPPRAGANVKDRIRAASRKLGWSYSRTRDAWYADGRISISADEMRQVEEATGIRYGRQEIRQIDDIIATADALLDGSDADFHRPFVAAMRSFFRSVARPGTEG